MSLHYPNLEESMRRVLAIDGGGVRGIIPAVICENIESWAASPIHKLFDLIAGTSTGGIIALGLSAPPKGKTASDLVRFYVKHGPKIFSNPRGVALYWRGPKYRNDGQQGPNTSAALDPLHRVPVTLAG